MKWRHLTLSLSLSFSLPSSLPLLLLSFPSLIPLLSSFLSPSPFFLLHSFSLSFPSSLSLLQIRPLSVFLTLSPSLFLLSLSLMLSIFLFILFPSLSRSFFLSLFFPLLSPSLSQNSSAWSRTCSGDTPDCVLYNCDNHSTFFGSSFLALWPKIYLHLFLQPWV